MIPRLFPESPAERRVATLAALVLVQALCAAFFVADVIEDLLKDDQHLGLHISLELIAAIALCAGVVWLLFELRDMLRRMASMDRGIQAARGDMATLIDGFFTRWGLTPSERDVALLILKGFDNETIAGLRGVATGTIRAQSTRIYAKAGVEGRVQLFSIFMEELLAGPETPVAKSAGSFGVR